MGEPAVVLTLRKVSALRQSVILSFVAKTPLVIKLQSRSRDLARLIAAGVAGLRSGSPVPQKEIDFTPKPAQSLIDLKRSDFGIIDGILLSHIK
jgi:hypothetical protein